jgi:putative ABC transport system substrate-binding protein
MSGKQLELVKDIVPRLSGVAVLGNSIEPGNAQALKETELAAGAFGARLQYLDVRSPKEIETAFQAASKGRADALIVLRNPLPGAQRTRIVQLAAKSRLPAIYSNAEYGRRWPHVLRAELS